MFMGLEVNALRATMLCQEEVHTLGNGNSVCELSLLFMVTVLLV